MKKINACLVLLAVCSMVSISQAAVSKVQVVSSSGVSSNYDHTSGITTWSQGASGWVMTDDYKIANFTDVSITGSFSGAVDTTSGGYASAIFNSGTWSMHLESGGLNVDISGSTVGNYVETEGKFQEGHIDGRAIVIVDSATFSFGNYGWGETTLEFENGSGAVAGLIADIALPQNSTFSNYETDDYSSTNTTITLYADESVVPEPATLCLLGLGGLGLIRRRKA
jgi:hypothetical protein